MFAQQAGPHRCVRFLLLRSGSGSIIITIIINITTVVIRIIWKPFEVYGLISETASVANMQS